VPILKNGCPLDSDFDGVYDYKDLEPNSKAMLYVDEFGRSIKNNNVQFDTIIVKEVKNFKE
jgi:energy-converting hydrogenase Eha subunit F